MLSVVIASTWMNMGSATLIYLAALQNIPGELYEAAELDGAGIWQRIRHVTIPQTRLILLLLAMLQIVATMQMFIEPFVLTNGGGGVGDNALGGDPHLPVRVRVQRRQNYNSASALGVILMLVLAAFSGGFLWVTRERDASGGNRWQD